MNVARSFLLVGAAFLIVGLLIGMYMAGSGNHDLALSHAHVNLIGFVLSAVFALTYAAYPAMTEGRLGAIHFWLHFVGAVVVNVLLFLLLSGSISDAAMVPLAPISEALILIGAILFGWNVWKNVA